MLLHCHLTDCCVRWCPCTPTHTTAGDDLRENFAAGHVCWDDQDLVAGRPTGAVRASLGALTTFEEVHLLLRLIHHYWLRPDTPAVPQLGEETAAAARSIAKQAISASMAAMATTSQGSNSRVPDQVQQPAGRCASPPSSQGGPTSSPGCTVGRLTGLFLYPVKSCAAQQVRSIAFVLVCCTQHVSHLFPLRLLLPASTMLASPAGPYTHFAPTPPRPCRSRSPGVLLACGPHRPAV